MLNAGYTIRGIKWSIVVSCAAALWGCGGGGDGGASNGDSGASNGASSQSVPGTLASPQYASGSAQLAAFNLLNEYRAQCGFPALQQNTVLDQAAMNHAKYMGINGAVSDKEVPGKQGFTGINYVDRATSQGAPSGVFGTGVSIAYYTNATLTKAQYGRNFVTTWLSGVYHSPAVLYASGLVGIGEYETAFNGNPEAWGSMSLLNTTTNAISSTPLTFPCDGVSGVPYSGGDETPAPPNTSGSWGTPVVVTGNVSDTILLQNVSITGPSGTVTVQIMNSATDPNHQIQSYQAVAYPTSPLQPNTQYSVSLTGTVNSKTFSRSFTFTTGNVIG